MNRFRSLLNFVFGGALLGGVSAALVGQRSIPWYYQPAEGAAQCSCRITSTGVANSMVYWEGIGLLCGAVAGLIAYIFFLRLLRKRPGADEPRPAKAG